MLAEQQMEFPPVMKELNDELHHKAVCDAISKLSDKVGELDEDAKSAAIETAMSFQEMRDKQNVPFQKYLLILGSVLATYFIINLQMEDMQDDAHFLMITQQAESMTAATNLVQQTTTNVAVITAQIDMLAQAQSAAIADGAARRGEMVNLMNGITSSIKAEIREHESDHK